MACGSEISRLLVGNGLMFFKVAVWKQSLKVHSSHRQKDLVHLVARYSYSVAVDVIVVIAIVAYRNQPVGQRSL